MTEANNKLVYLSYAITDLSSTCFCDIAKSIENKATPWSTSLLQQTIIQMQSNCL